MAHPPVLGPVPAARVGDLCWHCYNRQRAGLPPGVPEKLQLEDAQPLTTAVGAKTAERMARFGAAFTPPLSKHRVASLILEAWRPGAMGVRAPRK